MPTNRIVHKALGAPCKVCDFGHQRQIADLALKENVKQNMRFGFANFGKLVRLKSPYDTMRQAVGIN